jgi:hypothetical protein
MDRINLEQIVYPSGLRLRLDREQLEALGITEPPPAGKRWQIEATAVVTHSATEDPDADGDVDGMCVELQLTELGVSEETKPVSNALQDRAAALLYRQRNARKAWRKKVGERDIGGSPEKGEFGVLNRRYGG